MAIHYHGHFFWAYLGSQPRLNNCSELFHTRVFCSPQGWIQNHSYSDEGNWLTILYFLSSPNHISKVMWQKRHVNGLKTTFPPYPALPFRSQDLMGFYTRAGYGAHTFCGTAYVQLCGTRLRLASRCLVAAFHPGGGKVMLLLATRLPNPLLLGGEEWEFCILSPQQVRPLSKDPCPLLPSLKPLSLAAPDRLRPSPRCAFSFYQNSLPSYLTPFIFCVSSPHSPIPQ